MKINFSDIKSKLKIGQNGSPILAVILFVVAFMITLTVLGGGSRVNNAEHGQKLRDAVEMEQGKVIATINDVNFYERDLEILRSQMFYEESYYYKLSESQQKAVVGQQLVLQYMVIHEFDRLSLTLTQEDIDSFIEKERKSVLQAISDEEKAGKAYLEYIEGYGCTFEEYWKDENIVELLTNSLKYEKAMNEMCKLNNKSEMSSMELGKYLAELIDDGTYKVTLFDEPFVIK